MHLLDVQYPAAMAAAAVYYGNAVKKTVEDQGAGSLGGGAGGGSGWKGTATVLGGAPAPAAAAVAASACVSNGTFCFFFLADSFFLEPPEV
ncbi:hypothetical protein Ndes2437A_g02582 [Nannochloris sp. 'desiccata']